MPASPINPARVRDGRWHHCAATFDGHWLRVYLDGDEIGRLERPGQIRAGGSAPGCIGSSNGGETFQGALDDLRIYAGRSAPRRSSCCTARAGNNWNAIQGSCRSGSARSTAAGLRLPRR